MVTRRRTVLLMGVAAVATGAVAAWVRSGGDSGGDVPRTSGLRFAQGVVEGTDTIRVTSVRCGPDGRLYVGQQTGIIRALSLERRGPGSYRVMATEVIGGLVDLPNHNDDGAENRRVNGRQLTGIEGAGPAEQRVM